MSKKTVIVGDVHGCTGELEALLETVKYSDTDRLVFVGDLVARGPDSVGTLELARHLDASIVRGNHEERLLSWRRWGKAISSDHERVVTQLTEVHWQLLESTPWWIDLPEHGIRVVHAGLVPGLA